MTRNRFSRVLTLAAVAMAALVFTAAPANAAVLYFDGGATDIPGTGDGASQPSTGTWDTTIKNWDQGAGLPFVAWNNAGNNTAIIGGGTANATITLGTDINLGGLTFENGNYSHTITGYTLNFAPGSVIDSQNNTNNRNRTITSGITGSPSVRLASHNPSGGSENRMFFAPEPGKTQTLGQITNPYNDGTGDKHLLVLDGTTTGNTIASITGDTNYGYMWKQGTGTWTVNGNVKMGLIRVYGGTLAMNGTVDMPYAGLVMYSGGTVSGNASFYKGDRRAAYDFVSGSAVAPGTSIGTISFDWGTGGSPTATQWTTYFRTGSIYDWEIGAGNTTDLVHIDDGRLVLEGFTLKILDAGGTPAATDQLPVFTYGTLNSKTLSLGSVVFDTSALGPTWSASGLTLTDDGVGTIYLTGLSNVVGAAIPEPSTFTLAALGLLGLGWFGRRRRRR